MIHFHNICMIIPINIGNHYYNMLYLHIIGLGLGIELGYIILANLNSNPNISPIGLELGIWLDICIWLEIGIGLEMGIWLDIGIGYHRL